jgi:GNAT superfamily N-acetyltransferase
MPATTIRPLTAARLGDLRTLFGTSKTTTGCYCTWFLIPSKECSAGWSGANQDTFEAMTGSAKQPMGLLAYQGNDPIGWCAAGPRSRYTRALRSNVLKGRDADEDARVWLVPCFYVRRDARKGGVTRALLEAAVDLARAKGASAVEGFPLAGDGRRSASSAYLGVEPLFAACGFIAVGRPTAGRVIMRRDV